MLRFDRDELRAIRQKSAVLSVLGGLLFTANTFAVLVSVAVMVVTGAQLTPGKVFMMMAFMNSLKLAVCKNLGYGLQILIEAMISFTRIQRFLLLPNLTLQNQPDIDCLSSHDCNGHGDSMVQRRRLGHSPTGPDGDPASRTLTLKVLDVTLCSNDERNSSILHNVTLEACDGDLVVLTGPVGSGKSSIIAAINGEVVVTEGTIFCSGTIAYVSQNPWVFSGTIRENILFGKVYDQERFQAVVTVCALKKDLEMFPNGEMAIVGEKGVVLSGGQRARVSLARAVYTDADLYLIDDPLSAVDANVSQYIFEECICGLLSTKTRVLVTNQTNHMEKADHIIVVSKGAVLSRGKFVAEMTEARLLDTSHRSKDVTATRISSKEPSMEGAEETADPLAKRIEKGLQEAEEDRMIGAVSMQLYWKYFRSGQSIVALIGLLVLFLITQGEVCSFSKNSPQPTSLASNDVYPPNSVSIENP